MAMQFNVYMFDPPYDPLVGYTFIHDPTNDDRFLVNPKLTLEMGKTGSFEFVVPINHVNYNDFKQLVTVVAVSMDTGNGVVELFRGRVLTNNRDLRGNRKICCEGVMAYLVDSVQRGFKFPTKTEKNNHRHTARYFLKKVIDNHNAMFPDERDAHKRIYFDETNSIDASLGDKEIIVPGKDTEAESLNTSNFNYKQIVLDVLGDKWSTSLDMITDCLIDNIGGYARVYCDSEGHLQLEYRETFFRQSSQLIELGENLIDINEDIPSDDIFTVLIPLGEKNSSSGKKENLELSENTRYVTVEGRRLQLSGKEIRDVEALEKYGRIVRTENFSSVTSKATLLEDGERFLVNNLKTPITYEVKAVDMSLLGESNEPILIGDSVNIISMLHGINEYVVCTKIEYSFDNPANNTYTFGNPMQDLTQRYRQNKKKSGGSGSASSRKTTGSGKKSTDTVATGEDVADSVEEATKATEQKAQQNAETTIEEKLAEFYQDYIHFNTTASGTILTIGDALDQLGTMLGVTFDGTQGTINLHSITTIENDLGELRGQVESGSNSTQAWAALQASYSSAEGIKHEAELKVLATADGTTIEGHADAIKLETNAKIDDLTGALTRTGLISSHDGHAMEMYSLTQLSDDITELGSNVIAYSNSQEAWAALQASYSAGEGIKHEAELKVLATADGSTIEGHAEKLDLHTTGVETKLGELTTALTYTGLITEDNGHATKIYSSTDIQKAVGAGETIATLESDVKAYSDAYQAWAGLQASYSSAEGIKHEAELKVVATASGTTIEGHATKLDIRTDNVIEDLENFRTAVTNTGIISFDNSHGLAVYSHTNITGDNGVIENIKSSLKTYSDSNEAWAALQASYSSNLGIKHEAEFKVLATANGSTIQGHADKIELTTNEIRTQFTNEVGDIKTAITRTGLVSFDQNGQGQGLDLNSVTDIVNSLGTVEQSLRADVRSYSSSSEAWSALQASFSTNEDIKHEAELKVLATANGSSITGEAEHIRFGLENKWGIDIDAEQGIHIGDHIRTWVEIENNAVNMVSDYVSFRASDGSPTLVEIQGKINGYQASFDSLFGITNILTNIYSDTLTVNNIVIPAEEAGNGSTGIYKGSNTKGNKYYTYDELKALLSLDNVFVVPSTLNDYAQKGSGISNGGSFTPVNSGTISAGSFYSNGFRVYNGSASNFNVNNSGDMYAKGTLTIGDSSSYKQTYLYGKLTVGAYTDTSADTTIYGKLNVSGKIYSDSSKEVATQEWVNNKGYTTWTRSQIENIITGMVKPSALIGGTTQ